MERKRTRIRLVCIPAERSERVADVVTLHAVVHAAAVVGGAHGVEFGSQITGKSILMRSFRAVDCLV